MTPGSATRTPFVSGNVRLRELFARCPDVVPLLVLHRGVRADDRRPGEGLRSRLTDLRVQQSCGKASSLDVSQRGTCRVPGGDRRFAAEPGERERAPPIDLAAARRLDL